LVTGDPAAYNNDYRYSAKAPDFTSNPNAVLEDSVGGIMNYFGPSIAGNGVCNACHGAVVYIRAPNLGPKVIQAKATPGTVSAGGTTLITATVYDPDGDFSGSIVVDLSAIGGSATQAMNDSGINGDVTASDGIYSYEYTVPFSTTDSPVDITITATDDASNTGEGLFTLFVVETGSIYLDTSDATYVCTWTLVGGDTVAYGGDYRFRAAGSGSCTATWVPDIPAAGNYEVYAWWKAVPNRATDAPYTINYDGGSTTVDVNQEINGGQWNLLGTFSFAAGTSGTVVLSDDADEFVIADAIKLKPW
jgi:hypothetical protein